MVDFPAPDSPISPSTLPLARLRETPSTMTTSRGSSPGVCNVASIRRSRMSSRMSAIAASTAQVRGTVQNPVDHQVDGDGKHRDGGAGNQRRGDAEDDAVLVLLHHAAPVGRGGLYPEPEKGKRRQEQNRKGEAQAQLGDQRRQ